MTLAIIATNIVAIDAGFGIMMSRYDGFAMEISDEATLPGVQDLLSTMFSHRNGLHLLSSMVILILYGWTVERRLGRILYLLVYLTAAFVATIAFWSFTTIRTLPILGSSGATSGVIGAYIATAPNPPRSVLAALGIYPLDSRRLLLVFGLVGSMLWGLMYPEPPTGFTWNAHLSGFAAGVIISLITLKLGFLRTEEAHSQPSR